jgi:TolA-binding protein
MLLAKSYLARGFEEEAVLPLKNVSAGHPTSSFAAESDKLLSSLIAEGLEEAALSAEDRFRRAENYFYSADYGRAIVGYSGLLTEPEFSDRARFHTAIAFARLRRYKESERAFRDYLSLKKPAREAQALYWLAQVSMKQGRQEGVFESERRLLAKYRDSDERARVLMMIARIKDGKDPAAADRAYKTVIDEFSASLSSEEAFWNIAWESYSSGEWADAYEVFPGTLPSGPGGGSLRSSSTGRQRAPRGLGRKTRPESFLAGPAMLPRALFTASWPV